MNPPQPPQKKARRENQIQIQGPRPSPLKINDNSNSNRNKKPPIVPKHAVQAPDPVTGNQPVIIYSVSPKPIYVEASNFRSIVQHLTGRESTASESSIPGEVPVSPAARFASIERTSPGERERRERRVDNNNNDIDIMSMMIGGERNDGVDGLDMSQFPGILSPAPANLPGISSAMFSPVAENQSSFGVNDLLMSPFMSNLSFMPSPSTLFLSNAPIVSPSPSSSFGELFNTNFDF